MINIIIKYKYIINMMIENINGKDNFYAAGRAATVPLFRMVLLKKDQQYSNVIVLFYYIYLIVMYVTYVYLLLNSM
jgi:hypothetical protein